MVSGWKWLNGWLMLYCRRGEIKGCYFKQMRCQLIPPRSRHRWARGCLQMEWRRPSAAAEKEAGDHCSHPRLSIEEERSVELFCVPPSLSWLQLGLTAGKKAISFWGCVGALYCLGVHGWVTSQNQWVDKLYCCNEAIIKLRNEQSAGLCSHPLSWPETPPTSLWDFNQSVRKLFYFGFLKIIVSFLSEILKIVHAFFFSICYGEGWHLHLHFSRKHYIFFFCLVTNL